MKGNKILGIVLSTTLTISAVSSAWAGIGIKINGSAVESDVEPQIVDGRTMVPVRAIFEGLGATVDWNSDTKTVIGKKDNITIKMVVGEKNVNVNGATIEMDSSAMIIDERTFAPARYVAECFGYEVNWNSDTKEVIITDTVESPAAITTAATTTTQTTTETTTAQQTTVATTTAATTVETTSETTTTVADLLNSSPVADVGVATYKLIKDDIKLAFKNYYVGNAESNGRFQPGTYNKLLDMWDSTAKTAEEKKYVAQSKIVYQNMIITCKKIDQRKVKYPGRKDITAYCNDRKDKLSALIDKYFTSTNIDEATKNAEEIKKFAIATVNN